MAISCIPTNTLDCQADQRTRATTTRTTARKPNVMTTQTEALKSAIEFAEYCLEELDLSHMASNQAKRLVQKSKEALSSPNGEAQPEQEKERCVGCEACIDTACGRDECPKGWPKTVQPEQEPVAWVILDRWNTGKEWPDDCFSAIPIDGWTPLYTTPPQRTEQEQQIETLKRCLFQMQEAAKDLVKQAKSLPSTQRTWVELTAGEISKIWGELPQTSNEEKDAIEFGFAIETALRKRNA